MHTENKQSFAAVLVHMTELHPPPDPAVLALEDDPPPLPVDDDPPPLPVDDDG